MSTPIDHDAASALHARSFLRLSRLLHVLTWGCGLLGTAFSLARWWWLGQGGGPGWFLPVQALQAGINLSQPLAWPWPLVGLAVEALPLASLLYTLLTLHRICAAFLRGQAFSAELSGRFRQLGWGFVAMAVTHVLYGAGVTALLSWLASGQHGGVLAVSAGSFEVSLLMVGVMMLLLAQVMAEGHRLQTESEQFV